MGVLANIPKGWRIVRGLLLVGVVGCDPAAPLPPEVGMLPPLPAASVQADPPRGAERPVRELRIALVGEVRGELEPCGCPTLPFGGFARRQVLLGELAADGLPLIHLDAGETLLKGVATARSEASADRARLLLALSRDVGVDAWAPGPTDLLALGDAGLAAADGPPAVSATWQVHGAPLLPPARVVEAGGLRVGVIGLSAEPVGRRDKERVTALDPVAAARDAVAGLPADLDLVVALGHLSQDRADAVATGVPGVDLVLTTRDREVDDPRHPLGTDGRAGALVVETPDRGRYLQVIQLRLGSARGEPLQRLPDGGSWRALGTARAQVRHARAEGSPRLAEQERHLAELEARFADLGRGRNLVDVSTIPLGTDLDGPAAVSGAIDDFKGRTLERAAARAEAPPEPHTAGYASSGACVSCHAQEFARWGFSDHAKAWTSLVKREAVDDPECVGCHSTGFGEPGGFGELTQATVRKYKAVQCEACHGPMGGHPDRREVHGRPVTEATCRGCHDPANSPGFDYESFLPRASCQAVERAAADPDPAP